MNERLLKKINRWEVAENIAIIDIDVNELTASIRDDLEKLYNTRKGTVLIDDEYGLQDFVHIFNGYSAPDVEGIQKSMAALTKTYEKRLSTINVEFQEAKNSDSLCFLITARFIHHGQDLPFSINAYLYGDGSVTLGT